MQIIETAIEGVVVVEPDVYGDHRGFFMETYQRRRYENNGILMDFVQDNLSYSKHGTLRGLHFQISHPQSKLVQVIQGEVFDVAVDVRVGSPDFGKWVGVMLSDSNKRQLFIPEGFAHGFCVVSDSAMFLYKCSDYYDPADEMGILWNDPVLDIEWPVVNPLLSDKDKAYSTLKDTPRANLPIYNRV